QGPASNADRARVWAGLEYGPASKIERGSIRERGEMASTQESELCAGGGCVGRESPARGPDALSEGVIIRNESPAIHFFQGLLDRQPIVDHSMKRAHLSGAIEPVAAEDKEGAFGLVAHKFYKLSRLGVRRRIPNACRHPVVVQSKSRCGLPYLIGVVVLRPQIDYRSHAESLKRAEPSAIRHRASRVIFAGTVKRWKCGGDFGAVVAERG